MPDAHLTGTLRVTGQNGRHRHARLDVVAQAGDPDNVELTIWRGTPRERSGIPFAVFVVDRVEITVALQKLLEGQP